MNHAEESRDGFSGYGSRPLRNSSLAGDKPEAVYGDGANQFSLATGSPGELGLLKVLAETFGKRDNAKMAWYKAGSGESLKLLQRQKSGPDYGARPGRGKTGSAGGLGH